MTFRLWRCFLFNFAHFPNTRDALPFKSGVRRHPTKCYILLKSFISNSINKYLNIYINFLPEKIGPGSVSPSYFSIGKLAKLDSSHANTILKWKKTKKKTLRLDIYKKIKLENHLVWLF